MHRIKGPGTLAFFKELLLRFFNKVLGELLVLLVNYTLHTYKQ